jgi:hypothetical protein
MPRIVLLLGELGGGRDQDPEQDELTRAGHPAGLEPVVHRRRVRGRDLPGLDHAQDLVDPCCRDEPLSSGVGLIEPVGVTGLEAHHGLADQVEAVSQGCPVNPGNPYRPGHNPSITLATDKTPAAAWVPFPVVLADRRLRGGGC